ncbi:MAG: MBL fold metallo-hydrolase [Deltaproteobacteria bacterium]|nr:MBL fold metallo-hydrolase [Deltaproteobacteria bacterium]
MQEILEIIPVGPFQCNCIILGDPQTKEAIVIDPGDEVEAILDRVKKHGLCVKNILHTHTHIDHIGGTTALQKATNARVMLHKADLPLYEKMDMQGRFLGLPPSKIQTPVAPDEFLKEGQQIEAGNIRGTVLHTPGHTPGSCGFYFPHLDQKGILFPGDTLFAGSIGRTDLWQGDYDQEIQSIKKKYLILPDQTIVVPGHGPNTNIGQEKQSNPFLN